MKKYLLTAIIAAASTMSFAQSYEDYGLKIYSFVKDYYYMRALSISSNGRYIAGEVGSGEGTFIYDVETDDCYIHIAESAYGSRAEGVSDAGVAAAFDITPMTISIDGTETELDGNQGDASFASDITPDGSIVVGSVAREAGSVIIGDKDWSSYYGNACYWIDGELHRLPEPTAADVGLTEIYEDEGETDYSMDGTHASFVSNDGSVIVGYFYDRWSTWPCIAWIKGEDGEYTCDPICKGYYQEDQFWDYTQEEPDNPYFTFHPTGLSGDGTYIALDLESSQGYQNTTLGRYNRLTGELEVADNEDYTINGSGIANDGTILARTGGDGTGDAYIWKPGADPKRLRAEYSDVFDQLYALDEQGEHWPMAITPDGRYITGYAYMYDESISTTGFYSFYRLDTVQYANPAGIVSVTNNANDSVEGIYSVDGRRLNKLQPGINIVKKNGKTSKYLIR